MCVVTWVAVGVAAVSAAVGAVGAIQQGKAASAAANYNSQVAQANAAAVMEQSQQAAELQRQQSARLIGSERAAYGAAGVTADGTPLDVLASTASDAELARQTILYKGRLQAAGYQDESSLDLAEAKNDNSQSYMKASGLLLSGASSVAGKWPQSAGSGELASTGSAAFNRGD